MGHDRISGPAFRADMGHRPTRRARLRQPTDCPRHDGVTVWFEAGSGKESLLEIDQDQGTFRFHAQ
jgi:hypothetical protein